MAQTAPEKIGDRRRAEILAAAGALFAERGIRETTIRQIADQVGVLSGSLYYYFDNKQAMVHVLMATYVEDLLAGYRESLDADASTRERLQALTEVGLETLLKRPHETTILNIELGRLFTEEEFSYLRDAVDEVEALYLEQIEAGLAAGEIRSDIDPRFMFRMIMDVVKSAGYWFDPEIHTVRDVASDWWKVLGRGLFLS
jgi:AcrR family transcriptional regulator